MARKFSIEEMELEADRAAAAAQADDSTDPADIALVANYRDEIEKLREESGDTAADDTGGSGDGDASGDDPAGGGSGDGADPAGESGTTGDDPDTTEEPKPTEAPKDGEDPEGEEEPEEEKPTEGESAEPTAEAQQALEHALDTVSALHGVYGVVQRAQAKGGLTRSQVGYVQLAVEALASKVGASMTPRYSLEAFDSYSTRESQTAIVLEQISGVMTRIWDTIRRFFTALFKWVHDWLFGQKKSTVEAEKTVKELKDLAKQTAAKPKLPEEAQERVKQRLYRNYSRNLLIVDGDAEFAVVSQGLIEMVKLSQAVANFIEGPLQPVVERCLMGLDTPNPAPEGLGIAFHRKDFGAFTFKQMPSDMGTVPSGMFAGVVGPLPGGSYTVVQAYLDAAKPTLDTLSEQKMIINAMSDKPEGGIALCPDAELLQNMTAQCEALIKNGKAFYGSVGSNYREIEAFIGALLKDVDGGQWANKTPEETKELVGIITLNNRVIHNFMVKAVLDLQTYVDRTRIGAQDYIAASLQAINAVPAAKATP